MKVIVIERKNDFIAYIAENAARWESGSTWEAAVGRLVISLGMVKVEHVK